MNKKGFTLAEVLITLGIIGVVAAMTIPTLMNQTGQAEFKTGFKKIVSTLSQAITMNVALNSTDFSNLGNSNTTDSVYEMFNSRMNVMSTSEAANAISTGVPAAAGTNYTLFFNDGMAISFPNSCGAAAFALNGIDTNHVCKAIIDTNGPKKPNKLTNCSSLSNASSDAGTCSTGTTGTLVVGDRFSIRFYNQQVVPNGKGASYVMYN